MDLTEEQKLEIDKYDACYRSPFYGMSSGRMEPAMLSLSEIPFRGSYLDVGCGRGEMLGYARSIGFSRVWGTEVVKSLTGGEVVCAPGWRLPFEDGSFEVVSLFDVIEHLLPGDDERVCRELGRVASKAILITANNKPSFHEGVDLHINLRAYEEWDALFRTWVGGRVTWLRHRAAKGSEMWRMDLN